MAVSDIPKRDSFRCRSRTSASSFFSLRIMQRREFECDDFSPILDRFKVEAIGCCRIQFSFRRLNYLAYEIINLLVFVLDSKHLLELSYRIDDWLGLSTEEFIETDGID